MLGRRVCAQTFFENLAVSLVNATARYGKREYDAFVEAQCEKKTEASGLAKVGRILECSMLTAAEESSAPSWVSSSSSRPGRGRAP